MRLALLLFAAASTALTLIPSPTVQVKRPDDLLGAPFAAALGRYGPPDRGGGTTGLVHWSWRDDAGGSLSLAVHTGIVVQVDTRLSKGEVTPRAVPATGFYVGQPVAELLQRLGNPSRVSPVPAVAARTPGGPPGLPTFQVAADAGFWFDDLQLLVAAGHVLGKSPPPQPTHGPR